jgi:hypothetical protein
MPCSCRTLSVVSTERWRTPRVCRRRMIWPDSLVPTQRLETSNDDGTPRTSVPLIRLPAIRKTVLRANHASALSARGPAERAAPQNMKVQVIHRLASISTAVDNDSVSVVRQSQLTGHLNNR